MGDGTSPGSPVDVVSYDVVVEHLLASSRHRYEGRPSDGVRSAAPGEQESRELVQVRAGRGIVGDRFFGHGAHSTASVTVMAAESLDHVMLALGLDHPLDAASARRNIVVRGFDIDALKGEEFSLDSGDGPVLFQGHRPANPCGWMDVVLAPGAHKALRGRGGVRCAPLTDGVLRLGPAVLRTSARSLREPTLV
ncbi:MOSC domain-containing protein [Herbiconiux liukaitaii]|uniref:MOSC domain-containing protein n=1 Tax=Herbiconiux liukaitaii TaxID=3342799 RepID=UPI0035B933B5